MLLLRLSDVPRDYRVYPFTRRLGSFTPAVVQHCGAGFLFLIYTHADTILHIVSPRRRPSDRRQDDGPSTTTTATRNYVTITIIYYDRRRRSRGQAGDRTARSGNVAPAAAARSETLHTRRRRRRRAVFLFIFYTPLPAASVLFVDVRWTAATVFFFLWLCVGGCSVSVPPAESRQQWRHVKKVPTYN